MKFNKEIEKEIDELVRQIVINYKPEKIILFGSATNKSIKKPNDIDLLIIKETKIPRLRRRADALQKVSYNIPLDVIVLTPEELKILKNKKSTFIEEILKKGTILYG
ncbi:MAG: nucleotidyltransferase domain-containing protein [Promethearchaeota archaeon]